MSNTVQQLITEINQGLTQIGSSKKDEIAVMRAMLNDTDYEVGIYGKDGLEGMYSPAKEFNQMCASIVSGSTKIPINEAEQLIDSYEYKKSEASAMVNVSKEFINTYLNTGRKLPLGGRETSDIALSRKEVPASERSYPKKVGVNDDGTDRFVKTPTHVNAHSSVRVYAPCPSWVK